MSAVNISSSTTIPSVNPAQHSGACISPPSSTSIPMLFSTLPNPVSCTCTPTIPTSSTKCVSTHLKPAMSIKPIYQTTSPLLTTSSNLTTLPLSTTLTAVSSSALSSFKTSMLITTSISLPTVLSEVPCSAQTTSTIYTRLPPISSASTVGQLVTDISSTTSSSTQTNSEGQCKFLLPQVLTMTINSLQTSASTTNIVKSTSTVSSSTALPFAGVVCSGASTSTIYSTVPSTLAVLSTGYSVSCIASTTPSTCLSNVVINQPPVVLSQMTIVTTPSSSTALPFEGAVCSGASSSTIYSTGPSTLAVFLTGHSGSCIASTTSSTCLSSVVINQPPVVLSQMTIVTTPSSSSALPFAGTVCSGASTSTIYSTGLSTLAVFSTGHSGSCIASTTSSTCLSNVVINQPPVVLSQMTIVTTPSSSTALPFAGTVCSGASTSTIYSTGLSTLAVFSTGRSGSCIASTTSSTCLSNVVINQPPVVLSQMTIVTTPSSSTALPFAGTVCSGASTSTIYSTGLSTLAVFSTGRSGSCIASTTSSTCLSNVVINQPPVVLSQMTIVTTPSSSTALPFAGTVCSGASTSTIYSTGPSTLAVFSTGHSGSCIVSTTSSTCLSNVVINQPPVVLSQMTIVTTPSFVSCVGTLNTGQYSIISTHLSSSMAYSYSTNVPSISTSQTTCIFTCTQPLNQTYHLCVGSNSVTNVASGSCAASVSTSVPIPIMSTLPVRPISSEETNFLRFSSLMLRRAPIAVRKYFDSKHPPGQLTSDLSSNKQCLQNIKGRVITQYQWNMLYPKRGNVTSMDFDITLLICLLRNMTKVYAPATGFDKLPAATDVSVGADLARIKYYRNQIAHTSDAKLSAHDFNNAWNAVENAIGRLGGNRMLLEVQQLRVSPLDESDREIMLEISRLKSELQQTIPRNILGKISEKLAVWKEEDCLFVETEFSKKVLNCVKLHNIVSVTGNPGSGKSATIHHIALIFEKDGYVIIPIKTPKEIHDYHDTDLHQVFVVDDPFGEHFLDQHLFNEWSRWEKEIKKYFIHETTKLLLSSRLLILQSLRLHETSVFCLNVLNINDLDNELSTEEKKSILKSHVQEDLKLDICKFENHDCFPLLCRLFSKIPSFKENPAKFFRNPYDEYGKMLDRLRHNAPHDSPYHYCTLVLCMLFDDEFCLDFLDKKHEHREIIEEVYEACGLDSGTSKMKIKLALKSLKNVYVYENGDDTFTLIHTALRDIIAWHFAKESVEIILKYANVSLLTQRTRHKNKMPSYHEEDKLLITLTDAELLVLVQRICNELRYCNFDVAFNSPLFPNDLMETQIFENLKASNDLEVILFSKKADNVSKSNTRLWGIVHVHVPDENFYKNMSALTMLKFRRLGFLFYVIGFGWFQLFERLIGTFEDKVLNIISKGRTSCFILSLFSKDERMIKRMYEICYSSTHLEVEQICVVCKCNLTDGHDEYCPLTNLTPVFIPCLTGNESILSFLLKNRFITINDINSTTSRDLDSLTPLTACCRFGHTSVLELLLQNGADVNFVDKNGTSALLDASACGKIDCVSILLRHGAYIEHKGCRYMFNTRSRSDCIQTMHKYPSNYKGWTPLWWACYGGYLDIAILLLSHRANVSSQNDDGKTPLWIACCMGHSDIVSMLVQKGANVNEKDMEGRTPLWWACYAGNESIVTTLIEAGAKVDYHDNFGRSPLYTCCYRGSHVSIAKSLIEHGAKINMSESNTVPPIIGACCSNKFDMANYLIEKGAKVNVELNDGLTPLAVASCQGNDKIVSLLIDKGAEVNHTDADGNTPLLWACNVSYDTMKILSLNHDVSGIFSDESEYFFQDWFDDEDLSTVLVLLRHGADPNIKNKKNRSPIFSTLWHFENTCNLIQWGADLNAITEDGATVLHHASVCGFPKVIDLLITKGVDIETNDNDGRTPLFYASHENAIDSLLYLLEKGAHINAKSQQGETALFIASYFNYLEVGRQLLAKGADPNIQDNDGNTPLHAACDRTYDTNYDKNPILMILRSPDAPTCNIDFVTLLIEYGAKINLKNQKGQTALHLGCVRNHVSIASLLIANGANVNEICQMGYTPLFIAVLQKNKAMLKLLLDKGADKNSSLSQLDDVFLLIFESELRKMENDLGISTNLEN